MGTDTAILEECHANLSARRLNLAARKAVFQRAWESRDIALMETVQVPRITGNLGSPYATVRMPIAVGIDKPVVVHPVIRQIGKAIDRFYLEQGHVPEIVLCWAMDILLLGGPAQMDVCTDIVNCSVRLATESELAAQDGQFIVCDVRGL